MKRIILTTLLIAAAASAGVRVNLHLGAGHPIRRPARTVVVRQPRAAVVVRPSVTYARPVVFTRTVVALPPRERLLWEDSETIRRNEDWVDASLVVNNRGNRILMKVDGRAQIDFAEIHFHSGQVQVVDFNESQVESGTFQLLDFADGRQVDHIRVVARARTREARLTAYLAR